MKRRARIENKTPPVTNEHGIHRPTYDLNEELSAIQSTIVTNWKSLQGTPVDMAHVQYMSIVRNWYGFGSSIFYVTSRDHPTLPDNLSLGVSFKNVAIYKRDEPRPLVVYNYEDIT